MTIKPIFLITIALVLCGKVSQSQVLQSSLIDEVSYSFLEKLVGVAKENYPRIKSHASKIRMAETALNSAKLGWLNPLSLSYLYSPSNTLNISNPTFFSGYQIGFNLNLSSLLQTPSHIKREKEGLNVSKYDLEEYLLTLSTEVKTRYFTYLSSLKALKLASQDQMDAQNSFTSMKYRYEKGEAAFEDYINSTTQLSNSNKTKLDAEVGVLISKISLEELLGVKLEEISR